MNPRELVVLSHYRLPAQNPLMLGNEEIAAFLNAYSALWHPAAIAGATGPPRVASPYDHEMPATGHIYALPTIPPLVPPDDWDQRVQSAGCVAFKASPDRTTTLQNLVRALSSQPPANSLELSADRLSPFLAIGFGYALLEALCEAMEHENQLTVSDFWNDIQQAVSALGDPNPQAFRNHLQSAAQRLQTAREVLYPVNIHLLDLYILDEKQPAESLRAALTNQIAVNLLAPAATLEQIDPALLASVRDGLTAQRFDVVGGPYLEREDGLLPLESQLWNLRKGMATYKELLGQDIEVFGRKRFAAHPQVPMLLNQVGLRRALLLPSEETVLPNYRVTVINWPAPDGKQVETFTRAPHEADQVQTYFHWAHYLRKTIAEDHAATLAIVHSGKPAPPWYDDLLELARLGPVFGHWQTFTQYFNEVLAGEYASAGTPDEYHGDYLSQRTGAQLDDPISGFVRHLHLRRRLDSAWTLAAILRGLAGKNDSLSLDTRLEEIEDKIEQMRENPTAELVQAEAEVAVALAERLQSRSAPDRPGTMILNPCSFPRRLALELKAEGGAIAVSGPVKAAQMGDGHSRLVVEVPALGFAWIPVPKAEVVPSPARMRLADKQTVRNEFFEAEIDPATGGVRALRDLRTRTNRLGQQLVFNPGSTMRVKDITVTSTGPALGEIVTEGTLVDEHQQVLAFYRQRFRAWLGRPVLDLRIEIFPERPIHGFPWHAYYGARFAWRDERATLLRGVNGIGYVSTSTRPETPDYLEIRQGRQNAIILPGGLPFHQRQGGRMLDLILVVEGEKAQAFDIGLSVDRVHPMLTALGMATPITLVPTAKGPPHIGESGWLFHLDVPNLLLTSMRPDHSGGDSIVARIQECSMQPTQAELRCPRNPRRAAIVNALGEELQEASVHDDAAVFDVQAGDMVNLRVDFG
jgi:alpha-mannosidase